MNKEIWKPIPDFEGYYEASSYGRIKSLSRYMKTRFTGYWSKEKILSGSLDSSGYLQVHIRGQKLYFIHRLVMYAFYGKSDLHVNHKDGNTTNNRINNLEYCTRGENMQHAYDTNLKQPSTYQKVGVKHPAAHFNDEQILSMYTDFKSGIPVLDVATKYDAKLSTIQSIKSGRTYKHLHKLFFSLLFACVSFFASSQDSLVCIPDEAARYYLEANEERWILREKDSLSTQKISSLTEEILLKDQKIVTYDNDLKSYEIREATLEAVSTLKDKEIDRLEGKLRLRKTLEILGAVGIIILIIL